MKMEVVVLLLLEVLIRILRQQIIQVVYPLGCIMAMKEMIIKMQIL